MSSRNQDKFLQRHAPQLLAQIATGGQHPFASGPNPRRRVVYVDSTNGHDSRSGNLPGSAYATIAKALSVANARDLILVADGHAESISAAAGWVCDKAGVTVKGYGTGASKPTITFDTATTADIDITASDVTFENLCFVDGIDSLVAPFDADAAVDGLSFIDCDFFQGTGIDAPDDWFAALAAGSTYSFRSCRVSNTESLQAVPVYLDDPASNYVARTIDFNAEDGTATPHELFKGVGIGIVKLFFTCPSGGDLAGASATIEAGVQTDLDAFIATTTATTINENLIWFSDTPAVVAAAASIPELLVNLDEGPITLDINTAEITDGDLVAHAFFRPVSANFYLEPGDLTDPTA